MLSQTPSVLEDAEEGTSPVAASNDDGPVMTLRNSIIASLKNSKWTLIAHFKKPTARPTSIPLTCVVTDEVADILQHKKIEGDNSLVYERKETTKLFRNLLYSPCKNLFIPENPLAWWSTNNHVDFSTCRVFLFLCILGRSCNDICKDSITSHLGKLLLLGYSWQKASAAASSSSIAHFVLATPDWCKPSESPPQPEKMSKHAKGVLHEEVRTLCNRLGSSSSSLYPKEMNSFFFLSYFCVK